MRKLGVCRSAPLVVRDGDGLGPEVGCSVTTLSGCLEGDTVALSVTRNEGISVVGTWDGDRFVGTCDGDTAGIEVVGTCEVGRVGFFVGTCEGERVGFIVSPPVGSRVVGTCDGNFVGLMVGLIVGVKVLGRCVTGADVGSSVGAGLGLGVVTLARGTAFSRHVMNCKRRPGFREKLIVVVSTNVSTAGNDAAVEGQTDGKSSSHVQPAGPSTLLVTGSC
jgi:hypothetical protein